MRLSWPFQRFFVKLSLNDIDSLIAAAEACFFSVRQAAYPDSWSFRFSTRSRSRRAVCQIADSSNGSPSNPRAAIARSNNDAVVDHRRMQGRGGGPSAIASLCLCPASPATSLRSGSPLARCQKPSASGPGRGSGQDRTLERCRRRAGFQPCEHPVEEPKPPPSVAHRATEASAAGSSGPVAVKGQALKAVHLSPAALFSAQRGHDWKLSNANACSAPREQGIDGRDKRGRAVRPDYIASLAFSHETCLPKPSGNDCCRLRPDERLEMVERVLIVGLILNSRAHATGSMRVSRSGTGSSGGRDQHEQPIRRLIDFGVGSAAHCCIDRGAKEEGWLLRRAIRKSSAGYTPSVAKSATRSSARLEGISLRLRSAAPLFSLPDAISGHGASRCLSGEERGSSMGATDRANISWVSASRSGQYRPISLASRMSVSLAFTFIRSDASRRWQRSAGSNPLTPRPQRASTGILAQEHGGRIGVFGRGDRRVP
ncbi:unnamed protein product [Acanthosepion pharaonis]|uniref:Uncharacterized protein n=1 Tax=Acanthosepion pharaonis TaxID=158019 RepID=A0A812DVN8_ACAPH|nr:unnamed protein product [Sepia pharaonis]